MRQLAPNSRTRRHRREGGSAYLVALMVLVLVTMLGLSLVFSTQTEMIIGSNDRILQRAFYGAESGVAIAVARALVSNDKKAYEVELNDAPDYASGIPVRTKLSITPVVPISAPPCAYCEINNSGQYGVPTFLKVNHAFIARATMVGPNDEIISSHEIFDNVEFQPTDKQDQPDDLDAHKTRFEIE